MRREAMLKIPSIGIELNPGGALVIIGGSGSGKSRLLRDIARYYLDRDSCADGVCGARICFVSQDFENSVVFPRVVDEITQPAIARGMSRDRAIEYMRRLLARVDLEGFEHRYVHTLSGGELHTVAILSCVASNADILVLDEPLNQVDEFRRRAIVDLIREYIDDRGGVAVVADHSYYRYLDLKPRTLDMGRGFVTSIELDRVIDILRHRYVERCTVSKVLSVRGLFFGYGDRALFKDFELEVKRGEIVAVVGPNGAGKTTLVKIVSGILKPWRGCVEVCGEDIRRLSVSGRAKLVGVVTQFPQYQFVSDTLREELYHASRLYGYSYGQLLELVHAVSLSEHLDTAVEHLTRCMQQLAIAILALLSRPSLLVIDEVEVCCDKEAVRVLMNMVRKLVDELGIGALVTSHSRELVEPYVDEVIEIESSYS